MAWNLTFNFSLNGATRTAYVSRSAVSLLQDSDDLFNEDQARAMLEFKRELVERACLHSARLMGGEEAGGTVNVQPASIRAALAGWRDPYEEIFRRDTV